MTVPRIASLAHQRAARWLQGARRALEDERWDDAVYEAQMASEHAAKAVLLALGIDFPKQHDVSEVFVILAERKEVPEAMRGEVPLVADILAELAALRAQASYGFEMDVDVSHFEDLAPEAVDRAQRVLAYSDAFLQGVGGPRPSD